MNPSIDSNNNSFVEPRNSSLPENSNISSDQTQITDNLQFTQNSSSFRQYESLISTFARDGSTLIGGKQNMFSFNSVGEWKTVSTVKIFIPPGTIKFSIFGFLPQKTPYAVVSRLGLPPERTSPILGNFEDQLSEYYNIASTYNEATAFNKLLAGEEVVHTHPGGGSTYFSGNGNLYRWPLLQGQWLYMKVLINQDIYSLQGGGEVDLKLFNQGMKNIRYLNGATLPEEDGKIPVKPLGITLNQNSIIAGDFVEILPTPLDAIVLGECKADSNSPLAQFINISNYTISVNSECPSGEIQISCGDATDFSSMSAATIPKFFNNLKISSKK